MTAARMHQWKGSSCKSAAAAYGGTDDSLVARSLDGRRLSMLLSNDVGAISGGYAPVAFLSRVQGPRGASGSSCRWQRARSSRRPPARRWQQLSTFFGQPTLPHLGPPVCYLPRGRDKEGPCREEDGGPAVDPRRDAPPATFGEDGCGRRRQGRRGQD